jgi:predicted transcriptional regulator
MAKPKYPTSFHLSADAKRLLKRLADELGVSQAAVVELAIREYARTHGRSDAEGT